MKNELYYQNDGSLFMPFNCLIYETHFPKIIKGINTMDQCCLAGVPLNLFIFFLEICFFN